MVDVAPGSDRPIVGGIPELKKINGQHKAGQLKASIMSEWMRKDGERPKVTFLSFGIKTMLSVHSYEVVRDLFITKNAALDKTDTMASIVKDFFGTQSLLFGPNDDAWKVKRKSLSTAFYKDKMGAIFNIMKEVAEKFVAKIKGAQTGSFEFPLKQTMNEFFFRLIFTTVFEEDCSDETIEFEEVQEDGSVKKELKKISEVVVRLFDDNISLIYFAPARLFFDGLDSIRIGKKEKISRKNSERARNYIRTKLRNVRANLTPEKVSLISILCSEKVFDNEDMIIDTIVDFFFAAAATNTSTSCGMIHYLIEDRSRVQRLRNESSKYLNLHSPSFWSSMNCENILEIEYLNLLFLESLRIDPPVPVNSWIMMTQDTTCGGINFRAYDEILIDCYNIHHDPSQWQRPEEFLPERFDQNSPLYLTPSGAKRDAMSFIPFNGGKRICFGKTFAELVNRVIVMGLFNAYDFEFVDQKWNSERMTYNVSTMRYREKVQVRATSI